MGAIDMLERPFILCLTSIVVGEFRRYTLHIQINSDKEVIIAIQKEILQLYTQYIQ